MKKFIIIIFLFTINFNSICQDVTIKMTIEKEKTKSNRWKNYKSKETTLLIVTYQNTTKEAIYFRSGFKNFDFLFVASICSYGKIKSKMIDLLNNERNKTYLIDLFPSSWSRYCFASDPNNKELEQEAEFVNFYLGEVYQNFYKDYKKHKVYYIYGTNVLPLTEDNILGELKDYFIFLKKDESYSVKYDLTGFQILGGTYTFNYYNKQSEKYVETTSTWSEVEKKWTQNIEYLPVKVKNYKLYSGKFITNDVKISFD